MSSAFAEPTATRPLVTMPVVIAAFAPHPALPLA